MNKLIRYLQKIQIGVGGFFLFIFLISVVLQIATRYLSISATWTEEISMYSFIWAVFMGAAAMVYENKHFAFTSIQDQLKSEKHKAQIRIVIALIMLVFAVLMTYYGILIAEKFWNYKWINLPALRRGPTWLCVPICGLTSSIYLINNMVLDFQKLLHKEER